MRVWLDRSGLSTLLRLPTRGAGLRLRLRVMAVMVLLAAVVAGAMTLAVNNVGFLLRTEFFIEDVVRSIYSPTEPQNEDVVIVALDDATLSAFPYSSPIDRGFLNDLISYLAAQKPRAMGVDILFDQPTEPAKDAALRRTLTGARFPMVVSYINDPNLETADHQAYLDAFVPPALRGSANLASDPFDTVRYIMLGIPDGKGGIIPSFPRRLAGHMGARLPRHMTEIAWRGSPDADSDPFRIYPAQIVRMLNPGFFRNKIILVGSNFSFIDRHRTPFAAVREGNQGYLPGIVIQAHALAQLLDHRLSDRVPPVANFAIAFLFALLGAYSGRVERAFIYTALVGMTIVAAYWVMAFELFHQYRLIVNFLPPSFALMVASWMTESMSGQEARRQREFIRSSFSQYVPSTVVKQLIDSPTRLSLVGQRRELSLMFTDVASFTTLAEGLTAQRLGVLINEYFTGLCDVLFSFDGTVLKFMGDGSFSIFNAPIDQPDHASRAVRCAIALDAFAQAFAAEKQREGIPFGITRIGLHTGEAQVGNFGSFARKEYGAMGDAVNTAARLEGVNKLFGTRICVSEAMVRQCPDVAFRPLADVVVKGKSQPITIFEPLATCILPPEGVAAYGAAYAALQEDSRSAAEQFDRLHARFPDDPVIAAYQKRLAGGESGSALLLDFK